MQYLLFDGKEREALLPFTYTRPVAHLRIGIDRIQDKWEAFLEQKCGLLTIDYLSKKYPPKFSSLQTFINAAFLPTAKVVSQIQQLKEGEVLLYKNEVVAVVSTAKVPPTEWDPKDALHWEEDLMHLNDKTKLFLLNEAVIKEDFHRLTKGRKSAEIPTTNQVISPENIFIEEGAKVNFATLNASTGPIYIGANAEVMEGALLRGSIALGEHAMVKMGAKIYGGTTLGPCVKAGGELSNVLIMGYSNKGHDGFLGNAVIGEWCNIGAATDASNLKNSYAKIRVWDYNEERFSKTDLQFCGLIMGDFSRCGIHTMFNTATVVGICSNIFGSGFPRTFLPSFSFGGPQGLSTNTFEKAMEANEAMMSRRNQHLNEEDRVILQHVFELSARWRNG